MKIRTIEPIAISLPMLKPVVMAGEEIRRADNVLVRIEGEGGLIGWGEAGAAPMHTGEMVEGMVAAIQHLSPHLIGRDFRDIDGALAAMHGRMYGNYGAKAAIEIALHDLTGRATGKPLYALLGGRRRERMPILGVVGGGDYEGDLRDAEKKKGAGITIYKIKVGIDTPEKDAARTRDICKVLGSGFVISADANQGFTVEQALAYVRAVDGCGLDFLEQPVAAGDLDGMAKVAAATSIAIGADEGIHSLNDIARHHERKAARGVSLKAIKLGGIRAVAEAARVCAKLGMDVNISCKTGESSVACAAALHAASVIPDIKWGLTLTNPALGDDVTAQPILVESGYARTLERPGLGIDVDEDRVRRHRASALPRRVA